MPLWRGAQPFPRGSRAPELPTTPAALRWARAGAHCCAAPAVPWLLEKWGWFGGFTSPPCLPASEEPGVEDPALKTCPEGVPAAPEESPLAFLCQPAGQHSGEPAPAAAGDGEHCQVEPEELSPSQNTGAEQLWQETRRQTDRQGEAPGLEQGSLVLGRSSRTHLVQLPNRAGPHGPISRG